MMLNELKCGLRNEIGERKGDNRERNRGPNEKPPPSPSQQPANHGNWRWQELLAHPPYKRTIAPNPEVIVCHSQSSARSDATSKDRLALYRAHD
jgi:hypothetical protein